MVLLEINIVSLTVFITEGQSPLFRQPQRITLVLEEEVTVILRSKTAGMVGETQYNQQRHQPGEKVLFYAGADALENEPSQIFISE